MREAKTKPKEDELRPEYNFSELKGRVRGKYAERYREGTNLILLQPDPVIALRRRVSYALIGLFLLEIVGTLTVVFFVGLGLMLLSENVIISVLGAMALKAVGLLYTITKSLFPARTSQEK